MPDSPAGVYTLPPSYKVNNGDTSDASQHNPPFEDIAAALTERLCRDGRTSWTGDMNANDHKLTNLAQGTAPNDAVTLAQVLALTIPVGIIVDYAGSAAPNGWLLCNGQAVSRSSFPELFAAIGTTYGAGNGSTTFNVPDLRGRVVAGLDNMGGSNANRLGGQMSSTSLGAAGGAKEHTLTVAQIPAHSHGGLPTQVTVSRNGWGTAGGNIGSVSSGRLVVGSGNSEVGETLESLRAAGGDQTFSLSGSKSSNNAGGGQSHPNVQPTMVLNKIIKAR